MIKYHVNDRVSTLVEFGEESDVHLGETYHMGTIRLKKNASDACSS